MGTGRGLRQGGTRVGNRGGSPTYTDDHDLARGIKRKISISTPPMALKSQHAAKVRLHPLYEESVELIASKCS